MTDDDWRLTREEPWMYGAILERRWFVAPSPDWDHEHCALCWQKFMEGEHDDAVQEGLVWGYDRSEKPAPLDERTTLHESSRVVGSPTEERWICEECFNDFAARFGWSAVDPKP